MAKKKGVSKAQKKASKGFGGKGVSLRGTGGLNRKLSGVGEG